MHLPPATPQSSNTCLARRKSEHYQNHIGTETHCDVGPLKYVAIDLSPPKLQKKSEIGNKVEGAVKDGE